MPANEIVHGKMSRKPKIAVIGPGRIADAHLLAAKAGRDVAELAVVAGLPGEEDRLRSIAETYGVERVSIDAEAVFRDADIDAVILTVPNHLHRSMAIEALGHGKHVLVEKPLATTVADAEAMIAAAEAAGRTLMVAQCRRHFKAAQMAKARIVELGRPLSIVHILGVHIVEPRTSWWTSAAQTGGLVLGLNGPHTVDTSLWMIGAKPTRVYARTTRFRETWEGEDEASLMISFADGSTAINHLSNSMRPPVSECWITGPNGMMHMVQDRTLWLNGEQLAAEDYRPHVEGDSSFDAQFREFVTAIRDGRAPAATAAEVLGVVQVLEAARRSGAENRPVDIEG